MSDFRRLIIPISGEERATLHSEARAYLLFFSFFGGGFAIAAMITLWPFEKIGSFQWMIFGVLLAFFAGFLGLYLYQVRDVLKNLAAAKSVMFVGTISRKRSEPTADGLEYAIWIGDHRFDVGPAIFEEVSIGDRIAVREWLNSGTFLDYTTDARRIAELEARALKD